MTRRIFSGRLSAAGVFDNKLLEGLEGDSFLAAIEGYNKLIKECDGTDFVTQDLAVRLLADEDSHRSIFEGYLKEYQN